MDIGEQDGVFVEQRGQRFKKNVVAHERSQQDIRKPVARAGAVVCVGGGE